MIYKKKQLSNLCLLADNVATPLHSDIHKLFDEENVNKRGVEKLGGVMLGLYVAEPDLKTKSHN